MAAIFGSRTELGIKETGSVTSVSNDDTAKLMYYLDCKNLRYIIGIVKVESSVLGFSFTIYSWLL